MTWKMTEVSLYRISPFILIETILIEIQKMVDNPGTFTNNELTEFLLVLFIYLPGY